MQKTLQLSFLLLCILSFNITKAQTTYTWNGGTSGTWSVASNWQVGGATATGYPGQTLTNDIAIINTSNATVSFAGALTIGSLQTTSYGVSGVTFNFTGTTPAITITNGISIAQPTGAAVGITFSGTGIVTMGGTSTFSYNASFSIAAGTTVTFTTGSTLDMSASQGVVTNNGTLNFTGATLKLGSYTSLVSPGSIIANNSTFNISSTPSFITYAGKFVSNSCIFTIGSSGYIQSTSISSAFTATTSTFNLSGSGGAAYFYNNGTFRDHGSTYNLTGQGANIQNSGSSSSMHLSGTTVNFSGGSNAQYINNSGTFTADSASSINAATYQSFITNSGTFYAGTSGSACVITLGGQGANVANTGTFNLGSTSIIYPSSYQANVTNTSPGVFTLQSDANGSAAIGALSSTATCTGTFNVQRYFQGSPVYDNTKQRWLGRNYRIISSPVNIGVKVNSNYVYGLNYVVGATAGLTTTANSATNAFITGCTGGSTSAGNPSIYLYRESIIPANSTFTDGNFLGITNITNSSTTTGASAGTITASDGNTYSMPIGTGVFFFFRGAATNWAARTVYPFIAPENVTLTATGAINQQSLTVKDWYTPSSSTLGYTITGVGTGSNTNFAVRGFNMVGNPYPCSIDWNTINTGGITVTNINPTIYLFDPVTNQYDTYKSTGASSGTGNPANTNSIIASGQGFIVQANLASPSMVITEAAKSATSQLTGGNLLMGSPVAQAPSQLFRLRLLIDSLNYDDIVIGFNSSASAKYIGSEDAEYLPGYSAMEGLSSFSSDSVRLAMNFLPFPKQTPQVIRLSVAGALSRQYTFQKTQLDAIPQIYEIWLMDKYKKDSLDIRNNATYAFNMNLSDTSSFGNNRFQIVIRQNPTLGVHLLNFTATKVSDGSQVAWVTENEVNYTNFTVQRSTDGGVTFTALGGFTSSALGTYSFLDKNPVNGANQYRLMIQDLNGTISYSSVVTLTYGNGNSTIAANFKIYPSPTTGVLNVSILSGNANSSSSNSSTLSSLQTAGIVPVLPTANTVITSSYKITITNSSGALVSTATTTSTNWLGDVSSLTPGVYVIQIINNSNKTLVGTQTFIKI